MKPSSHAFSRRGVLHRGAILAALPAAWTGHSSPAAAPGMDRPGTGYTVVLSGAPDGERFFARHAG